MDDYSALDHATLQAFLLSRDEEVAAINRMCHHRILELQGIIDEYAITVTESAEYQRAIADVLALPRKPGNMIFAPDVEALRRE